VEALLNGIPVLGSRSGGIPEVMGEGGEVFDVPDEYRNPPYTKLFSNDFVEDIARRICRYFDDDAYYQVATERALAAHRLMHDLQRNGDRLFASFQQCLAAERVNHLNAPLE